MELRKFKEKNHKKVGIILFTIICILLISVVILYRTFAIFEVSEIQNVINGTIQDMGDVEFAFYKDNQIVKSAPSQDENYSFNPIKSHCTNNAKVEWNNDKWGALVSNIYETKTKCYLYFETETTGMFRSVTESTIDNMYKYKSQIIKIVFQTKIENIANEIAYFDESVNQDQSLISRIVPTSNDKYILYIQADGKIKANYNSGYLFLNFNNVVEIEGIENFDTSLATSLYGIFKNMNSLQSIDVSYFNVSKVKNLSDIFNGCSSLSVISGINNWDTSSVISMMSIFAGTSVQSLNLSNWKTGNVTSINYLFYQSDIKEIKGIAEWDTSSLESMEYTFQYTSLETLNLSGWDTKNVIKMRYAFSNSTQLTKIIYGPYFQKNSNADITGMFVNCPANHPDHSSWNV